MDYNISTSEEALAFVKSINTQGIEDDELLLEDFISTNAIKLALDFNSQDIWLFCSIPLVAGIEGVSSMPIAGHASSSQEIANYISNRGSKGQDNSYAYLYFGRNSIEVSHELSNRKSSINVASFSVKMNQVLSITSIFSTADANQLFKDVSENLVSWALQVACGKAPQSELPVFFKPDFEIDSADIFIIERSLDDFE